ncbi:MAG: 2-oxoglutarate dehydrogenase complex dihydrolipoyllysine-residue succinyltransferase [Methylococcaceae bacterium]|nr:2-oxoglutarate dehydrogenase complex dihydrolipoyllysine-residue succinyltransferase [Methylococcaceae bacterium]
MKTQVLVPHLPESVADATLISWHKKAGEAVAKNESLVDLETDKVVLEVPAPESGILVEIMHNDGATVTSGNLLAVIEAAGESVLNPESESLGIESETASKQPKIATQVEPVLSPAVRRIVLENDLDPSRIPGTGKHGRLTKTDVLDYIESHPAKNESPGTAKVDEPPAVVPVIAATAPATYPRRIDSRPEQRVAMTRLRVRVAERLLQAQQNAAMLTTFNEVNLQAIIEIRNRQKEEFLRKHGVKLGFMPFFVKASVEALKQFPVVNASIDKQDIIYHGYYDIGIAVASDRGLVVPIVRDANTLDFAAIENKINEFGKKAREGQLSFDDLSGGTFTITNGGVFGSMMSTPILNPPQSAILGMHAISERAVVEKEGIVARPMMYLALSYDHRIIDGREAVQFLVSIKRSLEDPARLLLNL